MKTIFLKNNFFKSLAIFCIHIVKTVCLFIFFKLCFQIGGSDLVSNYAIIDSYALIFTSICTFGFHESSMRIFNDFQGNLKKFSKQYIKLFLLIFFFSSPIILFTSYQIENFYFIYLVVFLNIIIAYFVGIIRAVNYVFTANIFNNIFPIFLLIGGLFIFKQGLPGNFIFPFWIIFKFLLAAIVAIFFLKLISKNNFFSESFFDKKTIFYIALPITLVNFVNIFQKEFPVILLGNYDNSLDLISFKIATKITSFALLFRLSFYETIKPSIAKFFKENKLKSLIKIVNEQNFYVIIITSLFSIFIFIFGEKILYFLSPEKVLDINILLILMIGIWLTSFLGPVDLLYVLTKYEKELLLTRLIFLIFFSLLAFPIAKNYGGIGLAFLIVSLNFIRTIINRFWIMKKLKNL